MQAEQSQTVTVAQAIEIALRHQDEGRYAEAEHVYRQVLAVVPDHFDALHLCGIALLKQGKAAEASDLVARAVAIEPTNAIALSNLGAISRRLRRLEFARECCEKAIAADPQSPEAHHNLAAVLTDMGLVGAAIAHRRTALALRPGFADGHYDLGRLLLSQGRFDEALQAFAAALRLNPEHIEARWASTIGDMGWVYERDADKKSCRSRLASEIAALDRWFDARRTAEGFRAVGEVQPFHLVYSEASNRDVLELHGRLCARLMAAWARREGVNFSPGPQRARIRVGIVSAQVRSHSVWHALVKGWVRHLDSALFEVQVYCLNSDSDQETEFARSRSGHFEHGPRRFEEWVETILRQQPDVLIYPEIGLMEPITMKLASLRLAPVQMTSWGHPETSGLATMDYFLSAEGFEPDAAQSNYTEQLVLLPNLGCCYESIGGEVTEVELHRLGIGSDRPLLLCPGTPFKYSPEYDWVLPEIARRVGTCQLIFFFATNFPFWVEQLRKRLAIVFVEFGLDPDRYLVFAQSLSPPAYRGLMKQADLVLDTLGFSGFNTAVQAIECGLPIVTREGRFLRGRLASGVLKRIGLRELVADSEDEYVETSVRLIQDPEYRNEIRDRILRSRSVLYNDLSSIRALEKALQEALGRV